MAGEQTANMSATENVAGVSTKEKLRAALKREFQKQVTHPYRFIGGHQIVDPGIQRYMAANTVNYEYFKATPKTARIGILATVLPIAIFGYLLKKDMDEKEHEIRTGQVSYRDRNFKFK